MHPCTGRRRNLDPFYLSVGKELKTSSRALRQQPHSYGKPARHFDCSSQYYTASLSTQHNPSITLPRPPFLCPGFIPYPSSIAQAQEHIHNERQYAPRHFRDRGSGREAANAGTRPAPFFTFGIPYISLPPTLIAETLALFPGGWCHGRYRRWRLRRQEEANKRRDIWERTGIWAGAPTTSMLRSLLKPGCPARITPASSRTGNIPDVAGYLTKDTR